MQVSQPDRHWADTPKGLLNIPNDRKTSFQPHTRNKPGWREGPLVNWAPTGLPVDDSLVLREAEDAGFWVSFLRLWGHTSNLDKAEAHLIQAVHGFPMLVKSSSNAYRVSEFVA